MEVGLFGRMYDTIPTRFWNDSDTNPTRNRPESDTLPTRFRTDSDTMPTRLRQPSDTNKELFAKETFHEWSIKLWLMLTAAFKLHPEVFPESCRHPDRPPGRPGGNPIFWYIFGSCFEFVSILFGGLQALRCITSFYS